MARRSRMVIGGGALLGLLGVLTLGAAAASGATTGPPVLTAGPVVRGSPGVGKTVRTDNGSWSTSATFAYQWLRCSANYAGCRNIQSATAAIYRAVAADVGHVLGVVVTATNPEGSASALSTGTGPVEAKPPGAKHKPQIKGTAKVGQRVYEASDQWTRSPYRFTAHWLRCAAEGNACVRITGKGLRCSQGSCIRVNIGTEWEYRLAEKDVGHRIRVRVAARNGAGRATSTSAPTRIIEK
jgi:hypothetical protein